MTVKIKKRNGVLVNYDGSKIVVAITSACKDAESLENYIADPDLPKKVERDIDVYLQINSGTHSVEDVSDLVEDKLIFYGAKKVAKVYMKYRIEQAEHRKSEVSYVYLSKNFLSKYKKTAPPMTELGTLVYYRTYSRFINSKNRREYWWETLARVIDYNVGLAKWTTKEDAIAEAEFMYDSIFNLKQFPSGRTLWSGGTTTAYTHPSSQFNCFTKDTEFLTENGIKNFGEFVDGETVSVLNRNGKWSPSVVKEFGEQEIVQLNLRRRGTKSTKTINTTKDHLWFIRRSIGDSHYDEIKTEDLKIGSTLMKRVANSKTKVAICDIGIQHGITYGDGTYNKDRDYCLVDLIGKKKELAKYFGDKSSWVDKKADGLLIRHLPNSWKELPSINMNKQYLKGFLAGLLLTDGRNGSSVRITQKNKQEVSDIRSIFEKLGMPTSDIYEDVRTNSNLGDYENPYTFSIYKETIHSDLLDLIGVTFVKSPDWIVESVKQTNIIEPTYCVVEPETSSFTLTSGIHTHNCAFKVFDNFNICKDITYLLMLGVGFGFSVEKPYVNTLPKVRGDVSVKHLDYSPKPKYARKESTEFNISGNVMEIIVGDSKLGWANAVDYLVKVFYAIDFAEIDTVMINYGNVRPFGERLKGFGGTASGHGALKTILEKIARVMTKNNSGKKKLKPIDAMDIANIIAEGIVVGGVRRSAEMCLSSDGDTEVMNSKMELFIQDESGNWISNQEILHRMMSNNSTAYWGKPAKQELKDRFEIIKASGENNFFNLEQAHLRNPNAKGTNPCGEILLDSEQFCNLVTINCMAFALEDGTLDLEGLLKAQRLNARMSYRTTIPTLELPEWDAKQKRDRLLGLSLTGWQDMVNATNLEEEMQKKALRELRRVAREEADAYADKLGFNHSLLITTVKPEGTISQLPTVSSGVHFSHSPYYIRRVRMNASDPLVNVCEDLGYPIFPEVGQTMEDCKTKVVEFPIKAPEGDTKYNVSAIRQLEIYKMFMEEYVDHNASNTISVRPEEWDGVVDWIYDNWDTVVGVTFLSLDDSFYQLLPYEACDEEEFNRRVGLMKPFNPELLKNYEYVDMDDVVDDSCVGGACPIR